MSALSPFFCTILLAILGGLATRPSVALSDPTSPESAGLEQLTILFTNDLKGRLLPGPYFEETRGGMARLVTLLSEVDPNGEALIVDGGDALGPDQLAQFDGGRLFADLMSRAGYVGMVPGNHDLNYGIDTLRVRAADAGFHFLAVNLVDSDTGESIVTPCVVVERQGIRILLTGLLSPGIAKIINPMRTAGIEITDPAAALGDLLATRQRIVDYDIAVVLVHMPPLEALELARVFPGVSVFVAGDNPVGDVKGGSINLVELASGTRIVSTPEKGPFLGRIEALLERDASGSMRVRTLVADLIPVDAGIEDDPQVVELIEQQKASYNRERATEIGRITEEIDDSPAFVSDLMRSVVGTEVAFINRGTLRPVKLKGSISRAVVDSLLRFDDTLVRLDLTGAELSRLAGSSRSRDRAGQRLVFSGYDAEAKAVNGIPLDEEEVYSVATTAYLAGGGDDYLDQSRARRAYGEELEEIVSAHIRNHGEPLASLERALIAGGTWKARSKLSNSLTLTNLNDGAGGYAGVSQVSGRDAMAWNALLDVRLSRLTARRSLTLDLQSSFGQVREKHRFKEAADRLDVDLVCSLQGRTPAPFVAVNMTTVWSAPSGQDHPITLRGSSGLQTSLGDNGSVRLGLGLERDLVAESSQVGLEVVPEYERELGVSGLASRAKLFFGATENRKVSLQHYNSLTMNLAGNLHVSLNGNLFFHWDNAVRDGALKSELQVALGYDWRGKRARK